MTNEAIVREALNILHGYVALDQDESRLVDGAAAALDALEAELAAALNHILDLGNLGDYWRDTNDLTGQKLVAAEAERDEARRNGITLGEQTDRLLERAVAAEAERDEARRRVTDVLSQIDVAAQLLDAVVAERDEALAQWHRIRDLHADAVSEAVRLREALERVDSELDGINVDAAQRIARVALDIPIGGESHSASMREVARAVLAEGETPWRAVACNVKDGTAAAEAEVDRLTAIAKDCSSRRPSRLHAAEARVTELEAERDRVLGAYHRENDGRLAAEAERDEWKKDRDYVWEKGVELKERCEAAEAERDELARKPDAAMAVGWQLERRKWTRRAETAEAERDEARRQLAFFTDGGQTITVGRTFLSDLEAELARLREALSHYAATTQGIMDGVARAALAEGDTP